MLKIEVERKIIDGDKSFKEGDHVTFMMRDKRRSGFIVSIIEDYDAFWIKQEGDFGNMKDKYLRCELKDVTEIEHQA